MTVSQDIDYEALAQEAMRGLVRVVLLRVAKTGLPGEHHFYVAFNTQAPGVIISKRLKEKYPEEMTIVLQHRFWDLIVTDERFEVKLTFDGIPERLAIPFRAVKVFFDPSVPYGLQFEESELTSDDSRRALVGEGQGEMVSDLPSGIIRPDGRSARGASERSDKRRDRAPRKPKIEKPATGQEPKQDNEQPSPAKTGTPKSQPAASRSKIAEPPQGDSAATAKVVNLDQFRKNK